MVNLHVWAVRFVRIIVHLELWSARHFQFAFSQPDFQGNCSMLASFEYCKARCDVSLLVSCLHSLVFCNTRIICAFEGELSGAFARLAKLAPLETTTSLLLSTWPRFRSSWSTKFALSHTKKSREQDLKKKERQRTNATGSETSSAHLSLMHRTTSSSACHYKN